MSNEEAFIRLGNSILRLEPDIKMQSDIGVDDCAKLAYITVGQDVRCHLAPEVISLVGQTKGMAPRLVQPEAVATELVQQWIDLCIDKHQITCNFETFPELSSINLIDVELGEVVAYRSISGSAQSVEYLCLSYVWGALKQEVRKLGDKILRVPATIRDAMTFTKEIGKRYLWVDSVGNQSYRALLA